MPGMTCSDYHLFGPLKDDMTDQHYKNYKAVQEVICR